MSLFGKIANFFHTAAVKVSDAFVKLFGKDAAEKFAQGALSLLKSAEGKIVLDAVEAVETLNPAADGASKRAQAFAKILDDFKTQGLQVSESVVSMLIELAVQFLKGAIVPA
ncbi:MAG: phage holin, LLH family [Terriglobales bacterium]